MPATGGRPVPWCPESWTGQISVQIFFQYLKYFVKVDMIIFCMHFRYFGTQKRNDFVGSLSSGCATDFRHYNYRRVPYLGGSDHFRYLNKMVAEAVH